MSTLKRVHLCVVTSEKGNKTNVAIRGWWLFPCPFAWPVKKMATSPFLNSFSTKNYRQAPKIASVETSSARRSRRFLRPFKEKETKNQFHSSGNQLFPDWFFTASKMKTSDEAIAIGNGKPKTLAAGEKDQSEEASKPGKTRFNLIKSSQMRSSPVTPYRILEKLGKKTLKSGETR